MTASKSSGRHRGALRRDGPGGMFERNRSTSRSADVVDGPRNVAAALGSDDNVRDAQSLVESQLRDGQITRRAERSSRPSMGAAADVARRRRGEVTLRLATRPRHRRHDGHGAFAARRVANGAFRRRAVVSRSGVSTETARAPAPLHWPPVGIRRRTPIALIWRCCPRDCGMGSRAGSGGVAHAGVVAGPRACPGPRRSRRSRSRASCWDRWSGCAPRCPWPPVPWGCRTCR